MCYAKDGSCARGLGEMGLGDWVLKTRNGTQWEFICRGKGIKRSGIY